LSKISFRNICNMFVIESAHFFAVHVYMLVVFASRVIIDHVSPRLVMLIASRSLSTSYDSPVRNHSVGCGWHPSIDLQRLRESSSSSIRRGCWCRETAKETENRACGGGDQATMHYIDPWWKQSLHHLGARALEEK